MTESSTVSEIATPPKVMSSSLSAEAIAPTVTAETLLGFGSPAATDVPVSKHLNFSSASESAPPTPATPFTGKDEALDYNSFVIDTLMWTNKVRSGIYLVAGIFLILSANYFLSAGSPLLTVICQLTLVQMGLNFLRYAISPSLQQKATWLDSAWTAFAIGQVAAFVKTLAALHDKHLSANSPHKHLAIASSLWLLSMFARLITACDLLLAVYIGLFAVPKLYTMYRGVIDPAAKDAFQQAKARLDAMDRRAKAAGITLFILLLGYRMSTIDLIIAGFVVCVYARSQLPEEVEQFSKKIGPIATPLGKTALSMGGQIGKAMEGAVERFDLTPTPSKKKNL